MEGDEKWVDETV